MLCNMHATHRFTPAILMDRVKNIGCIVDLTATYRYYDPAVRFSNPRERERAMIVIFLCVCCLFDDEIFFFFFLSNRFVQVFTSSGIRHEKIFCEGHVVPSAPTVQRYADVSFS